MATTTDAPRQLDDRDVRALNECMTAIPIAEAPGLYDVTHERTYRVDTRHGSCECKDARYRDPEGGCKHVRRARFAAGEREIPEWVNDDAVDPQLGEQIAAGTEFQLSQ